MGFEKLEQIGLTKGEIKVYEALLRLGESTKTPIAVKSEISPGKIYDVLERLSRKGLISSIKKEGIKHFRVSNPNQLKAYIDKKKSEVLNEELIVNEMLPNLLNLYTMNQSETDAEVYKGWRAIQRVYDDIIENCSSKDYDYVLGATRGGDPNKTKVFFNRFNMKRYEKGIKLKVIYNKNDREFAKQYLGNKKYDEIRYLNLQTPAEINIYKNKVIILILLPIPIAIVITSKEAYNSFKIYFDSLWKISKE